MDRSSVAVLNGDHRLSGEMRDGAMIEFDDPEIGLRMVCVELGIFRDTSKSNAMA